MSKVLQFLLLLSCYCASVAPQPLIVKSEPIDDLESVSYNKVLLMKNGKTCYAHFSGDEGIDISIYSTERKLTTRSKIASERWDGDKISSTKILGTYEINGEMVIFLQQAEKRTLALYRLRINTDDGKLLKEDVIAVLRNRRYLFNTYNASLKIDVVKDTRSGCYAVFYYDNLDEEADDAIKVLHFDSRHTLLSTARIISPDNKQKNIVLLDAAVQGDKCVFISTYYSGNENDESKIYVSKLNAGDSTLTTKALDFTGDFKRSKMHMLYNYQANKLQLLIATFVKSKHKGDSYFPYFCEVNPSGLDVAGVRELSNEKIVDYARIALSREVDFTGLPQWLVLNEKGEPIIIKQSMALIYTSTAKGATYVSGSSLNDIGISELASDGTVKQSYFIPHHGMASSSVEVMDIKDMNNGTWSGSDRHYSFRYVLGKKNSYIVHLAYKKNVYNPDNVRWHKKDHKYYNTNVAYAAMRSGHVTEGLLFGVPGRKKDQILCLLDAADQNDDGLFATVITEKKGKRKESKIAWVNFE